MPTVTATQVLTDAFTSLNVYQPSETISAADATLGLRFLNLLIGQWAQQGLTVPATARLVFPLVAGKGTSTNPYTLGPGGDLNGPKPPNQDSLERASLLLMASTPPVELPRGLMTNDAYELVPLKDLTSTLFTSVYYAPTFAGGLGSIFLWPVPTDLSNRLVLYLRAPLGAFPDLTTVVSIPDGYDDALYKNLMVSGGLARAFGRTIDPDMRMDALQSLATIKRSNVQLSDLANDFARIGAGPGRGAYNLITGEG